LNKKRLVLRKEMYRHKKKEKTIYELLGYICEK
jgi:hypothetical protein